MAIVIQCCGNRNQVSNIKAAVDVELVCEYVSLGLGVGGWV